MTGKFQEIIYALPNRDIQHKPKFRSLLTYNTKNPLEREKNDTIRQPKERREEEQTMHRILLLIRVKLV